jgi:flagellin-like hook-associated protein FlgL
MEMNFVRAEVGIRQQGLDVLTMRLEDEDTQLRGALSLEYDADMIQVVSDLTAQQATYEASLRTMAQIYQLTLLNFL